MTTDKAAAVTQQLFPPGSFITRYETHHGRVWMDHPVRVIADSGDQLAVLLSPGSTFRFHDDDHPLGPHPWRHQTQWSGPDVLQIYRKATPYSVWMFFDGQQLRNWYLNFETEVVRRADGFETGDHGLDLIIERDGTLVWKDVEDLYAMYEAGRITSDDVLSILAAARAVTNEIRRGERWWSSWDSWTPLQRE
jgi:hypothetical protein